MKTFKEMVNEGAVDTAKARQELYKDIAKTIQKSAEFKALEKKIESTINSVADLSDNKEAFDWAVAGVVRNLEWGN